MDRWQDRVAVVTGASSGIGAAICKDLLRAGLIVVGLARHENRITDILTDLPSELHSRLYSKKCDVSDETEVKNVFKWINEHLCGTDILVNAAGVYYSISLLDQENTREIKDTLNTQVMGIIYCIREAFSSMKMRNFDGHIVNINGRMGHRIPYLSPDMPPLNIVAATKYAVTALNQVYRQEFSNFNTKIKMSSVSPGTTHTKYLLGAVEMVDVPLLKPEDVSNAVLYIIGTPPHVEITELIVNPIGQTF